MLQEYFHDIPALPVAGPRQRGVGAARFQKTLVGALFKQQLDDLDVVLLGSGV